MKLYILTILVLFAAVFHSSAVHASAPEIGHVAWVEGNAQLSHLKDEIGRTAANGDKIYQGDVIKTETGDSIKITFIDDTNITLAGKDGELTIDQYVFDPENPALSKAHYSILRASFEFIGGLIDKGDQTTVRMDFGSIGIRGTKFFRSMKDGECWIYLEEGKIDVTNRFGKVDLAPGEGTRMSDKPIAPLKPEKWSAADIQWIRDAVHGN